MAEFDFRGLIDFSRVHVLKPQTVRPILDIARDVNTDKPEFVRALSGTARLLANFSKRFVRQEPYDIQGVFQTIKGYRSADPALVTILRAGWVMLEPFNSKYPRSSISFQAWQRDESQGFVAKMISPESYVHQAREDEVVMILDPAVALGTTAQGVIGKLLDHGARQENIVINCVIAAPEGIVNIQDKFPEVNFVVASLEDKIVNGYIWAGLGDIGERLSRTIAEMKRLGVFHQGTPDTTADNELVGEGNPH
jgi:uracil phosphoribosyltransferase